MVRDSAGRLVAAQIYDCFADGTFVNLTGTGGDASDALVFTVQIYAWNQQSYTANYAAIASNVTTVNAAAAADGGYIADPFLATPATWTTSCEATQTTNIEQVAVCQPLVPEATAQPPTPADGGEDAGADGGKDTGGDGKD